MRLSGSVISYSRYYFVWFVCFVVTSESHPSGFTGLMQVRTTNGREFTRMWTSKAGARTYDAPITLR